MVLDPTAEQIAEMTLLAADAVRGFGITPKARCSRTPISAPATPIPRARCGGAGDDPRTRAGRWKSTARCTPTPRWCEAIRDRAVPDSRLPAPPTC
jgi:malate dehydrogenase (oxaloacetate-decarboxylating)(NADP+)